MKTELIGRRIELVYCSDPYTRLQPGSLGTIEFEDDLGTVFVRWDSGSSLGLVPGGPSFEQCVIVGIGDGEA